MLASSSWRTYGADGADGANGADVKADADVLMAATVADGAMDTDLAMVGDDICAILADVISCVWSFMVMFVVDDCEALSVEINPEGANGVDIKADGDWLMVATAADGTMVADFTADGGFAMLADLHVLMYFVEERVVTPCVRGVCADVLFPRWFDIYLSGVSPRGAYLSHF